ncbi:shikimate kinase [Croceiramulus getboli]|nr:shikimate kinase [Flavobacteriaceae bacterium YJPT1-3]
MKPLNLSEQNILLLGYMGSGKSTIGQLLARELNCPFTDFDAYLEEQEQLSIRELFEAKGEIYFRKLEMEHLKRLLDLTAGQVISLGGGTPCYGSNMALINASNHLNIYLKAGIPVLVDRLWNEREQRPLLQHQDSQDKLSEFVGKHLFERSYYYNQAQYTIAIDGKSPKEVVEEIQALL